MAKANRIVRDGTILGLIGFAAVAVFYAVFDFLAARGFLFTVNLLGETMFFGLRDPAVLQLPIEVNPVAVLLYTALHFVMSLGIGMVVAWLIVHLEGPPAQVRLAAMLIAAGFLVTVFAIGMASTPIKSLLPWWSVVLANSMAVIVAGAYVLGRHPGLARRLMAFGREPVGRVTVR